MAKLNKVLLPTRLSVVPNHNLLLIYDSQGDFFVKAYTLDSFNLIKEFAKKGEGPSEQLSAQTLQYNPSDNCVYIADLTKRIIFIYSVDSILSNSAGCLPTQMVNVRTSTLNRPLLLNNGLYVSARFNNETDSLNLLNFYSPAGEYLHSRGGYPDSLYIAKYKPYQLSEIFIFGLSKSPDGSNLFANYYNTDIIEKYDSSGNLIKRIQGPDAFDPDLEEKAVGKTTTMMAFGKKAKTAYRGSVKTKNDTLFVLYDGKQMSEHDHHVKNLFAFDKNLQPLIYYKLDAPIFDFDIDLNTRILYGLSDKVEGGIYLFKIPAKND